MVIDLRPGNFGSSINKLFVYQNNLYFKGTEDGIDFHSLWKCDGENYPEKLLSECYSLKDFCIYNDLLFFSYNSELWSYDGINSPSQEVTILQGEGASMFSVYHDTLFFNSVHNYYGNELFFYDGTNSAEIFYDIISGVTYSSPDNYTVYNDALYFCPISGNFDLWCYNSDTIGAVDETNNMIPNNLFVYNDYLFFSGRKNYGIELWKYNSLDQTLIEYDIFPDSIFYYDSTSGAHYYIQNSSNPQGFCEYQDTLYFIAKDTSSLELTIWSYHETNGAKMARHIAQLVYDIANGNSGSSPIHLTVFNNKLYFTADDRQNYGRELWVHDPLSNNIESFEYKVNLSIFPNPSNYLLYYEVHDSLKMQNATLAIYDNVGKMIKENKIVNNKGSIDVSDISSGIYFLILTYEWGKINKKVVIK
jgi:ELWxxDGT repeat protein